MAKKMRPQYPIGAHVRKETAARRLGNKQCECGEARPQALIPESTPTICASCQRVRDKKSTVDDHHYAGEANDSSTVPVQVNDHRAELSVAQNNWAKETLENRDGSPLLAGAARVQGFIDMNQYLIQKVEPVVGMLEIADKLLRESHGPKYWINTDLRQFEPDQ